MKKIALAFIVLSAVACSKKENEVFICECDEITTTYIFGIASQTFRNQEDSIIGYSREDAKALCEGESKTENIQNIETTKTCSLKGF